VISEERLSVLSVASVKAALDIDWDDEEAQLAALQRLLEQVSRLEAWVARRAKKESEQPPLKDALVLLRRIVGQDTEPDPSGGGTRVKQEVAHDRIISLGDVEMRHGRKSRNTSTGTKRHIAVANGLIVATAAEPANVPEHVPAARLLQGLREHGEIDILDIDRGYLPSPAVGALHRSCAVVPSRAWQTNVQGLFYQGGFPDRPPAQAGDVPPNRSGRRPEAVRRKILPNLL